MDLRFANAPVSFGVFELADPDAPAPAPETFLSGLARAGYSGVDLGPVGWLGTGAQLRQHLDAAGLDLAGGWVDLPFQDADAYAAALPQLDAALAVFVAGRGRDRAWWPKPTLAVSSTPERAANPGGGASMPEIRLDAEAWATLARNVADAAARCRDAGLEPTFHHHVGTYVEAPEEIERFLELTDVGLTLDTGHLILGGGDPIRALADWGPRINHLHVKDAHLALARQALAERAPMREVWARKVFCPVGEGDLDVAGFAAALAASDFRGWLVVEQDILPTPADTFDGMLADQVHNLAALRELGLAGQPASEPR